MKKIIFSAIMLFLATCAVAQQRDLKPINILGPEYYTNIDSSFIDSVSRCSHVGSGIICDSIGEYNIRLGEMNYVYTDIALREKRFTDDTIIIYGLAAAMIPPDILNISGKYRYTNTMRTEDMADTLHIGLFKPQTNLPPEHPINFAPFTFNLPSGLLPPITYYAQTVTPDPNATSEYLYPKRFSDTIVRLPFYESYFDYAEVVTDSFYLCVYTPMPEWCTNILEPQLLRHYTAAYLCDTAYTTTTTYNPIRGWHPSRHYLVDPIAYAHFISMDSTNYRNTPYNILQMVYPILTRDPERDTVNRPYCYHHTWDDTWDSSAFYHPDTTATGDTTAAGDTTHTYIASPKLLDQFTSVVPNVCSAANGAAVVSSFHLAAVELYSTDGRLICSTKASGLTATIDTSHLPEGSYIVRIVTIAGSTTKKLIVR